MYLTLRSRTVYHQDDETGWHILSIVARHVKTPWIKSKIACVCKDVVHEQISKKQLEIIEDIHSLAVACIRFHHIGRKVNVYDGKMNHLVALSHRCDIKYNVVFQGQHYSCYKNRLKRLLYSFTIPNKNFEMFSEIELPIMAV